MTHRTENFGLSTIENSGDGTLVDDGFKFVAADRHFIDRLLYAQTQHRHSGGTNDLDTPVDAPELALSSSGGSLQAGIRIYYKYTLVDANGFESQPSTEASVDTPSQVATPGAPTLANHATTGGVLLPGQYYYVLSAYSGGVTTQETRAGAAANIVVPAGTSTNVIRITFPTLPANADGWNIYAKKPGSTQYYYVTSIDMTVVSPPTHYDEDGSPAVDVSRTSSITNTTLNANSVTVSFPGATPTVPDGFTWKIYRTFILGNYNSSLLHWVVEDGATPDFVDPEYVDVGAATGGGSPPSKTQIVKNPDPVNMTDGVEATGRAPIGNVTAFPFIVTFVFQGTVAVTSGKIPWTCPFPRAKIIKANARLGVGSYPASTPVRVDVKKHDHNAATATTFSIWSANALRPTIPVGQSYDVSNEPDVDDSLLEGDFLLCDVLQAGGGATPTDSNLVVEVLLLAQFDIGTSTFSSFGWL